MSSITRLKGTLYGDNGKIYVISNDRRLLLAKCNPEITIYEKSTQINVLGVIGRREKLRYCSIVFCPEPEVFCEVDDSFIRSVTNVDLEFDIQNGDSVIETTTISNLTTDDLDYNGNWKFEAVLPDRLAEKLLSYLQ